MQVYVINLERNPERFVFISKRLEELKINFNRIDAVDGHALSEQFIEEFRENSKRSKGWLKGQVGCFLSHRIAWQKIVDNDSEYGLVLEDDLHISSHLKSFIYDFKWIPKEADIVRIESTTNWVKLTNKARVNDRELSLIYNDSWGAGAYIISKEAAASLLRQAPKIWLPADTYIFVKSMSRVASGLKIYQLTPALVCQDKYAEGVVETDQLKKFDSEIELDHSGEPISLGLQNKLKRFLAPLLGYTKTQFKD